MAWSSYSMTDKLEALNWQKRPTAAPQVTVNLRYSTIPLAFVG